MEFTSSIGADFPVIFIFSGSWHILFAYYCACLWMRRFRLYENLVYADQNTIRSRDWPELRFRLAAQLSFSLK